MPTFHYSQFATPILFALLCFSAGLTACVADDPPQEEASSMQPDEVSPQQGGQISDRLEADLKGKSDTAQLAPGLFISGVPPATFQLRSMPETAGRQRKGQWCWAATMQMVVNFHGVDLPQEDIVTRAYGSLLDRPANAQEIVATVDQWQLIDNVGQPWLILADAPAQINAVDMIQDLHFNQPLIVGLTMPDWEDSGHAFVMSSITYQVDARGFIYPLEVSLRDPWPENDSFSTISWSDFLDRYILHIRVRALPV